MEEIVKKFLNAWIKCNWQEMCNCCQLSWVRDTPNPINIIQGWLGSIELLEYKIIKIEKIFLKDQIIKCEDVIITIPKDSMKDVIVQIMFKCGGKIPNRKEFKLFHTTLAAIEYKDAFLLNVRVIRENKDGLPDNAGQWGVNPISVLR